MKNNPAIFLASLLMGFSIGELTMWSLAREIDFYLQKSNANVIIAGDFSKWLHIFALFIGLLIACGINVFINLIKE